MSTNRVIMVIPRYFPEALNQAYFQSEYLLFEPTTPDHDAVNIVFAFPNTYTVGITSLGYQGVWANLATRSQFNVSRWFTDAHEDLPRKIEIFGFSFSWELDYVNILAALKKFEIPIDTCDRTDEHPLVFGGGPVLTANPEPFAAWFDIVLLGDGEELIGNFLNAYQEVRHASREVKLRYLAKLDGIYVPALYAVTYESEDGAIASIQPIDTDIPATIHKQTYKSNVLSASTVVTEKAAWESIFMVEVVRSCPEMCRFCLASYLTLPFRTASLETSLMPAIAKGLEVTKRLGLLGASITQHPEFDTLLDYLAQPQFDDVRLSLASVRTNTLTEKLAKILSTRDSRSVTIAIESGSERLREIINKKLHNDEIKQAAINAQVGGLKALKLYGMAGVPMENDDDIEQTIEMLISLRKLTPKLKITFGCSTFVPKSHTPWQWQGVSTTAEKKMQYFRKKLLPKGIDFRPESYKDSLVQALISRGDRRLTKLLILACSYSDGDVPSDGSYKRAFKELRGHLPPLAWYVHEDWDVNQILPWQHLRSALPVETLIKHRETSFLS